MSTQRSAEGDATVGGNAGSVAAWQRKSLALPSTLPWLYVAVLSTRDYYERTLAPLWQGTGLSRSTVSRANERIAAAFEQWRCIVHRICNVLVRVPKSQWLTIRKVLNRIFYASSEAEALVQTRAFAAQWAKLYPEAVATLGRDLADA